MNLLFVFDGYLAQTALEDSFVLDSFDGYLIYGSEPPSGGGTGEIIGGGDSGARGKVFYDETQRLLLERDANDWRDITEIFSLFLRSQN